MRGGQRPGSGRPPIPQADRKIPIGFGAPLAMILGIDEAARASGHSSRSDWLRSVVEAALAKLQAKPKKAARSKKKKSRTKPAALPSSPGLAAPIPMPVQRP